MRNALRRSYMEERGKKARYIRKKRVVFSLLFIFSFLSLILGKTGFFFFSSACADALILLLIYVYIYVYYNMYNGGRLQKFYNPWFFSYIYT